MVRSLSQCIGRAVKREMIERCVVADAVWENIDLLLLGRHSARLSLGRVSIEVDVRPLNR